MDLKSLFDLKGKVALVTGGSRACESVGEDIRLRWTPMDGRVALGDGLLVASCGGALVDDGTGQALATEHDLHAHQHGAVGQGQGVDDFEMLGGRVASATVT